MHKIKGKEIIMPQEMQDFHFRRNWKGKEEERAHFLIDLFTKHFESKPHLCFHFQFTGVLWFWGFG